MPFCQNYDPSQDNDGMTREEMTAWFARRGVEPVDMDDLLNRHAGKTEEELDALYTRLCGDMA